MGVFVVFQQGVIDCGQCVGLADPVPPNLWANQDVGVRLEVHTKCQRVDVDVVAGRVKVRCETQIHCVAVVSGAVARDLPPLKSRAERKAVAGGVDQVVVQSECVTVGATVFCLSLEQIALTDVLQLVRNSDVGHDRVHVALFDRAI